jgi:hypothetical protein
MPSVDANYFRNEGKWTMNTRAQFKIQQMVFVIIASAILFAIVSIFFISWRLSGIREGVNDQREQEVLERVRQMSGTPEFAFTANEDCAACVDMDKLFLLKNRTAYIGFWQEFGLLKITRVYPTYDFNECTSQTYPSCNVITLVDGGGYTAHESFVTLCHFDAVISTHRCELGKVILGFKEVSRGV